MPGLEPQQWITVYAALVATIVAAWNIWKEISERLRRRKEQQRVRLGLEFETVKNRPDNRTFLLVPLVVSNLGREPVIICSVVARGENSQFWPGEHSEPGAAYGIKDRVLPRRLEPGETVELPLFTAAAFTSDVKEIAVIDNEGREFKLSESHIRHAQAVIKAWQQRQLSTV